MAKDQPTPPQVQPSAAAGAQSGRAPSRAQVAHGETAAETVAHGHKARAVASAQGDIAPHLDATRSNGAMWCTRRCRPRA